MNIGKIKNRWILKSFTIIDYIPIENRRTTIKATMKKFCFWAIALYLPSLPMIDNLHMNIRKSALHVGVYIIINYIYI
jgi:hypothetical protein